MAVQDYAMPVAQLLALGDPRGEGEWRNYLELSFTSEHIPDLIRMALDEDLHWADSESKQVWSPLHAWRVLGQLRAKEAAEPLTRLLHRIDDDDDDWVGEELPQVFGMMGPSIIPVLETYLANSANGLYARVAASAGLKQIAEHDPEVRAQCVTVITHQLEQFAENDPVLSGFLVGDLITLKAIEAMPAIERAFAAKRVDVSIAGDLEDMQLEFGIKKARTTPRERTEIDKLSARIAKSIEEIASRRISLKPIQQPRTDDAVARTFSKMVASGEFKFQTKSAKPKRNKKKKK